MIYLISLLPGATALTLAPGASLAAVAAATVGVALLQHGVNLLNDVTDWRRGADGEKVGSWVRHHGGDLRVAARHGRLSLLLGFLVGTAALAAVHRLWVLGAALPLVALGVLYNEGERPLSYDRWGEWATGLCYGGVAFCLGLLAVGRPTPEGLLAAAAYGALAVAVLFSHQPPQVLTDFLAGKRSFAVRHGAEAAERTARALALLSLAGLAGATMAARGLHPVSLAQGLAALAAGHRLARSRLTPGVILGHAAFVVAWGGLTWVT